MKSTNSKIKWTKSSRAKFIWATFLSLRTDLRKVQPRKTKNGYSTKASSRKTATTTAEVESWLRVFTRSTGSRLGRLRSSSWCNRPISTRTCSLEKLTNTSPPVSRKTRDRLLKQYWSTRTMGFKKPKSWTKFLLPLGSGRWARMDFKTIPTTKIWSLRSRIIRFCTKLNNWLPLLKITFQGWEVHKERCRYLQGRAWVRVSSSQLSRTRQKPFCLGTY